VIKAEFSASLLQSSVSHYPLEIILICWFAAQETSLIIISWKQLLLWKRWNICLRIHWKI